MTVDELASLLEAVPNNTFVQIAVRFGSKQSFIAPVSCLSYQSISNPESQLPQGKLWILPQEPWRELASADPWNPAFKVKP